MKRMVVLQGVKPLVLAFVLLSGCGNNNGMLPLDEYENVDVEVWFYFERDNTGTYLGVTHGASRCGSMARAFAYTEEVDRTDWSYICVTTDGKHKIR